MQGGVAMYAVFKLGGNQHKASVGDVLEVDLLSGEVGDKVEIEDVLLLAKDGETIVGAPGVDGAKVVYEIVGHGRQKKVLVVKFKRRKKYRRKAGHRQQFTSIKITDVVAPTADGGE